MRNPKISVVMPVYNTEKYLAEAIESILNQTFKDFEFIIIDDGSTDKSLDIIKRYALKDDRIKIISRMNKGITKSLNEGIAFAQGEYIARMDSDDISLPQRFEKQVKFLDKNKKVVALGTKILFIDYKGRPLIDVLFGKKHDKIEQAFLDGKGGAIAHPSVMMRKKVLLSTGCYNNFKYAQDFDLFLRLAEVGKLGNLDKVLLKYRFHNLMIGSTKREEQLKCVKKALLDAYQRRGLDTSKLKLDDFKEESNSNINIRNFWWSLKGKNIKTARIYALKVFLKNPFLKETRNILKCAWRGY